jgi:hypothetical protein
MIQSCIQLERSKLERSKIIPISKKKETKKKEEKEENEYSLKQHFFDPSKSSPPNEFMLKLRMRMSHYNYNSFSNLDNLINE